MSSLRAVSAASLERPPSRSEFALWATLDHNQKVGEDVRQRSAFLKNCRERYLEDFLRHQSAHIEHERDFLKAKAGMNRHLTLRSRDATQIRQESGAIEQRIEANRASALSRSSIIRSTQFERFFFPKLLEKQATKYCWV